MNTNPIGILDSGVGGLTVTKEIVTLLPHESIIYIGDSAHTPYGALSSEEIHHNARAMIQFLLNKNAKLIVIACNTITVNCIDKLREEFTAIPIVGTVPVIKKAAELSQNKRIGILSTSQTTQSEYQQKLIKDFAGECTVIAQGTDALVPLIEQLELSGDRVDDVLKQVLEPFKKENIDTLALGCTHFPLLRKQMQAFMGNNVTILDSGTAIARQVQRILQHNAIESTSEQLYSFYTTGTVDILKQIVEKLEINTSVATFETTTL